jgi:MFS family permease
MLRTADRQGLGGRFVALWTATGLANLGDGLTLFLLPVVAVELTGAPGLVAGVTVMLTLPWALFGLQAGAIVDRVDRRRLMLRINLLRAGGLAGLTLAVLTGAASIPLVYVCALGLGVAETLVDTGLTALVPSVVAREDLTRANARIEATQNATNQFLGPPLGGALASASLTLASGTAGLVYVMAHGAIRLMGRPPAADEHARPAGISQPSGDAMDSVDAGDHSSSARFWREVTAGLALLWTNPLLRALTLVTAAMNVLWAAWTALITVYALDPDQVGLTKTQYGTLLTAMACGGVLGALAVEPLRHRLGTRAVLTLDLIGTGLLVGIPGLTTNALAIAAATFIGGAGAAVWRVIVSTLRQVLVPDHLLGRVYSASRWISWGVLPVGAALGGLVAEATSIDTVFLAGGAASIAVLVAFLVTVSSAELEGAS